MDLEVKKSEILSNIVGQKVLDSRYGKMEYKFSDDFSPWDFDASNQVTAMTVEMKYREDYTAEQLDAIGGACVELHKANNPENKNTVLLVVTKDGVCRMRDITGYTSTGISKPHRLTHKTTGYTRTVQTEWAYYTKWDAEWIDKDLNDEYNKELERLRQLQHSIINDIRNASKP